ncbi:MAG: histidine kinase dimerization/phosphoacceptor domain -containing protein [Vulcanimicrobiota bacterium]
MEGNKTTIDAIFSGYTQDFLNDLPISTILEDISAVRVHLERLKQQNVGDIYQYLKAHRDVLLEIAASIKIIAVNTHTLHLFKARSKEDFLLNLNRAPSEDSLDYFTRELTALAEGRCEFEGETTNRTLTGEKIHIYIKWATPSDGDPSRLFVHIIDITDRVATGNKLMHSERKLNYMNRVAQVFLTGDYDSSDNHILDIIMEALESPVGIFVHVDEQDELTVRAMTGKTWKKHSGRAISKDFPKVTQAGIWGRAIRERKSFFENCSFKCAYDPQISSVLSTPLLYQGRVTDVITVGNKPSGYDENDVLLLESIAAFIAPVLHANEERSRQERERLRMEQTLKESEELHRMMIETSPDVIITVDLKGFITSANEEAFRQTLYRREDIIGKHFTKLNLFRIADIPTCFRLFTDIVKGESLSSYELKLEKKDGSPYWCEVRAALLKKDGKPSRVLIVSKDITERRDAELQLKTSLKEKEILLKEIHHRVKNNMQIISSLLNLQAVQAKDPTLTELLQESKNRVRSMALIHEKLYRSTDLAHIDFSEYIRSLTESLFKTFRKRGVSYSVESKDAYLDIDKAIPCGLILNELISNTLKHAFPDGKTGKVSISFSISDDRQAVLSVSDNGIGFPPGLDCSSTSTLGIQLVNDLTSQLGGSVALSREKGAAFMITFQLPG